MAVDIDGWREIVRHTHEPARRVELEPGQLGEAAIAAVALRAQRTPPRLRPLPLPLQCQPRDVRVAVPLRVGLATAAGQGQPRRTKTGSCQELATREKR
jgi:hypothetical protein